MVDEYSNEQKETSSHGRRQYESSSQSTSSYFDNLRSQLRVAARCVLLLVPWSRLILI